MCFGRVKALWENPKFMRMERLKIWFLKGQEELSTLLRT